MKIITPINYKVKLTQEEKEIILKCSDFLTTFTDNMEELKCDYFTDELNNSVFIDDVFGCNALLEQLITCYEFTKEPK